MLSHQVTLFIEHWFACCCTTKRGIEYEISHVNARIQGQEMWRALIKSKSGIKSIRLPARKED